MIIYNLQATSQCMNVDEEMEMVGTGFHPTDEELINYYLKGKLRGVNSNSIQKITDIGNQLSNLEPDEIPHRVGLITTNDKLWCFFCRRKYKGKGSLTQRTAKSGFWKSTGKDRNIRSSGTNKIIGKKKTLVFYRGKFPGSRTPWILHEYRLPSYEVSEELVLCKLMNNEDAKVDVFLSTEGNQPSQSAPSGSGNQVVEDAVSGVSLHPVEMHHETESFEEFVDYLHRRGLLFGDGNALNPGFTFSNDGTKSWDPDGSSLPKKPFWMLSPQDDNFDLEFEGSIEDYFAGESNQPGHTAQNESIPCAGSKATNTQRAGTPESSRMYDEQPSKKEVTKIPSNKQPIGSVCCLQSVSMATPEHQIPVIGYYKHVDKEADSKGDTSKEKLGREASSSRSKGGYVGANETDDNVGHIYCITKCGSDPEPPRGRMHVKEKGGAPAGRTLCDTTLRMYDSGSPYDHNLAELLERLKELSVENNEDAKVDGFFSTEGNQPSQSAPSSSGNQVVEGAVGDVNVHPTELHHETDSFEEFVDYLHSRCLLFGDGGALYPGFTFSGNGTISWDPHGPSSTEKPYWMFPSQHDSSESFDSEFEGSIEDYFAGENNQPGHTAENENIPCTGSKVANTQQAGTPESSRMSDEQPSKKEVAGYDSDHEPPRGSMRVKGEGGTPAGRTLRNVTPRTSDTGYPERS